MNRSLLFTLGIAILFTSCVSKKKFVSLESSNTALTQELNNCKTDKAAAEAKLSSLQERNDDLKQQVRDLNNSNAALLNNIGDMATLSSQEAQNLEKSLEAMKEKDLKIQRMQDALTKKDSVTLALVTSLKGSLGNLNDEDIEVNVEKGVVFISISDKLLFTSGSYKVQQDAKTVLGKVAKVVNDKPDMDFLVEGHTDNVPVSKDCIADNWELSVMRATAIVKVLQNEFAVDPARMTAGGRGEYIPLVANDSPANKAMNRRTRIVVLPKLDQFYEMIEQGMKDAE